MSNALWISRLSRRWKKLSEKRSRSLLYELIRANYIVNERSSSGVLWSLLGPASMLLVLFFIFESKFGARIEAYPLFLLVGIVVVSFFIAGVRQMMMVLRAYYTLFLNTRVPRELVYLSSLYPHAYKLFVELFVCLVISVCYGALSPERALLVLPLLSALVLLVLGVGLVLSAVFAHVNDIDHLWNLLARLFFFVTPIFYSLDDISETARTAVYWLNPLTPFVMSFRSAFMDRYPLELLPLAHCMLIGTVAFAAGYGIFFRFESSLVERA